MNTQQKPEVVVVTGGGAGLGRAIVQSFARRGAHIGLVSRSQERLEDAQREVEQLGGKALVLPGDVADPATTEHAAERVEEEFGPIDIWVNDAMTTVFSPFHEMSAGRFQTGDGGHLPRLRIRHHGRSQAHAAAEPWDHRPGRLGAGVSIDSAPVGVLRRQARHRRVHRLDPQRAYPRRQSRPHHGSPDARVEHAPVLVVQEQHGRQGSAGAADLSAGGRCRGGVLGRAPPASRGLRRLADGPRHLGPAVHPRHPGSPGRTNGLGRAAVRRSARPGSGSGPVSSRCRATRAPTARSIAAQKTAAGSWASPCTRAG